MGIPCYWLEPSGQMFTGLRRYVRVSDEPCPIMPGEDSYHQATSPLGNVPLRVYASRNELRAAVPDADSWTERRDGSIALPEIDWPADDDPRWPAACGCGRPFVPADKRQHWSDLLYRVASAMLGAALSEGTVTTLRDAPPGALWDAYWMEHRRNADGMCMAAKTPGCHDWLIDCRASNCTMPGDDEHRCWVRHGTPPRITVDKNGHTCAAGAGSIQAGDYHGFLQDGTFT